ncbi:uncharacterized protein [Ptychodera flava]|uniref:uncharacterized protein n=1 Tax=Ptychodera flava TaxID=63121 RepID=UPI00396A3576
MTQQLHVRLTPGYFFSTTIDFRMSLPKANPEITYEVLTEDHFEEAAHILTSTFVNGNPVSLVLKLPYEAELTYNRLLCRNYAKDGVSVVAIDKELNKVIGAAVGTIVKGTDPNAMLDEFSLMPDEVKPYYKPVGPLFGKLERCIFESSKFLNNPDCKILKSYKISVHPDYEGRGIGTKLADLRRELGEKKDVKFISVFTTALGSQILYKKLGYEDIGEIFYKDYTYNDEKPFAGITCPPSAKAMVLQLY